MTVPPAFPPSTAVVQYGGWREAERRRAEQAAKHVLRGVPPERWASIVGAPDGAVVTFDASGETAVSYAVTHPSLDDMRGRIVRSDLDGSLRHRPDVLYVKPSERGRGVGAEIHGRRVAFGAEHGVKRLAITAARGDREVGYIVWPAMGYDGKLPQSVLDRLPEQLRGRTTIQELLVDEGGQKWWKKNGESIDVAFDLAPQSPSIMRWATYWLRRLAGK
jgi:GNAT superfamily N-acetyltransferase